MQGLCVSTYVFGPYTCYIAPYIYFLKRAYPDCYPIIFVHKHLAPEDAKAVNLLAGEFSFDIVENTLGDREWKKPQWGKAVRWLLWDKRFMDFQGVYIGDIDMLIMPEKLPLLEGHRRHCERLGLPFSNVMRPPAMFPVRRDLRSFMVTAQVRGLKEAVRLFMRDKLPARRLTGLHFFIPEQYEPLFSRHKDKYWDLLLRRPHFLWHDRGFSNEAFLYDFMEEFGCIDKVPAAPPIGEDEEFSFDEDVLYCPHHGIHVGTFRSERLVTRFFNNCRKIFSGFYDHYLAMSQEPLYQRMAEHFSPLLRSELDRMHTTMDKLRNDRS